MGEHMPESSPAEKPTKRGRGYGRPFVKGDPRIPAVRKRMMAETEAVPEPDGAVVEPADDGVPQQLKDMRHVYGRPASKDCTPGERACRRWLKSDIKSFMRTKSQLEARLLALGSPHKGAASDANPQVEDHGTRRTEELIEFLLKGAGEGTEQVSVKQGRCAMCGRPIEPGAVK
jgi:hypothetical protein